jgi:chemotaxis protein methyltransferase CheR
MSNQALQIAKGGTFPLSKMKKYTNNYIQAGGKQAFSAYYIANNNTVTLAPFLSEKVFFAQHNLVTDGSFNEFHVVICRNVLMYFNRRLQDQVHHLLYHSLCSQGILGLGKNDYLDVLDWITRYDRIDSAQRIFRKIK